ncbi:MULTISPECIES: NAD(P)/FAD-dependent oxidoreductase [unclassified Methylophaga]|uniref:NAD(P)/FAD-dependent oxidoreductase n=2 Tax=Methylophaga TaxID=40222 RepID=UPI000C98E628|nr:MULTISPECIES: NAD(P)/FAD-dependent oxidoreductase [unclassified Methylophaga]MBN45778.1 FAD-dependent oxidoreductase [Methylophaga sp.]
MATQKGIFDVIVIGAGPSGAVASALLNKRGYNVLVLERSHFPRFSIGESLLPQSMAFLEQADMLEAVQAAGFQFKDGAAFSCGERYEFFNFNEKFSEGWGTTFQVQRDIFDKVLADEAARQGVDIRYGQSVTRFDYDENLGVAAVEVVDEAGLTQQFHAKFVLDGSGYGRVLPKLLNLEKAANFEPRTSLFTHVEDAISDPDYDRNKILITVHPQHRDVWYWLIPFSNARSSVGVVASKTFIDALSGTDEEKLKQLIAESGWMSDLLASATFDTRIGSLTGYACDVTQMYGPGYALLGNAGEFLDPVFSSGVTIAFKSASLAVDVLSQQLQGGTPDWQQQFVRPLQHGVNTFREFVEGWYDGRLQDVIFTTQKNDPVKRMISSILAGYAWDIKNPFVKDSKRLTALAELCRNI